MPEAEKIRVLRLIARLNIGGPAIQAILLTQALNRNGFYSILATGTVSDAEGDMGYLSEAAGVEPLNIPCLGRRIRPLQDAVACYHILRLMLRFKPHIIHTHTAKAGALGRLAGIIYRRLAKVKGRQVRLVHTYHGHVFSGYFGPLKTTLYLWIERLLARGTDLLVTVSQSQRQEICKYYRVGQPRQFRVLPLGLPLTPFLENNSKNSEFRRQCSARPGEVLVGIIGRLTTVKNHHLFLEAARRLVEANGRQLRFLIVGDGELRSSLEAETNRLGLGRQVVFTGWQRTMKHVYSNLDVVVLTSNNEGTPVTLIEALAAARPVIATNVGGVEDLLGKPSWRAEGFGVAQRGVLVHPRNAAGLARGIAWLLGNPGQATRLARQGRQFVRGLTIGRLTEDINNLYRRLVEE